MSDVITNVGASTRRRGRFAVCVVAVLAVWVASACTPDHPTCYQGDYRACDCDAGPGLQACLPTQDGFADCVCGGGTPGLDAGNAGDAGDGG